MTEISVISVLLVFLFSSVVINHIMDQLSICDYPTFFFSKFYALEEYLQDLSRKALEHLSRILFGNFKEKQTKIEQCVNFFIKFP